MAMGARMATPTDTHFLTLAQWLSPAFPVGAFAYSHGLEAAVQMGWVSDAGSFEVWLNDVLDCGAGRSDALFLAASYHAPDASIHAEINAKAHAFAASAERLLETQAQGAAFCNLADGVWGTQLGELLYPVALGAAAKCEDLPLALTCRMYLQAFASNLIAAAQRLLPLGQTEGQAILRRVTGLCGDIAETSTHGDLSCLGATAFLSDIAAMKHETQHSRIFRT
jgi:urease accessory protein